MLSNAVAKLFIICDCSRLSLYRMYALLFIFVICAPTVLSQDPRRAPGHYCYVQSPIDSSIFNLTTIQHDHSDSSIRINAFEHLRIHFCRPLKDPCNGKQGYAVCLHAYGKEIGAGKEPPNVAIELGRIIFRYTGDQCNATHNYTVDIEMKCDFTMTDKVAVDLDIVYSRDQCGFQMSVDTAAACAKRAQTTCATYDHLGYYNLSPLMNLAGNYKIQLNNSLSVILNVCHSLLYGHHFQQCNHETMVCLVDETNPEEPSYTRLGNINDYVRFSTKNGTVSLDLSTDTPCHLDDDNGMNTIRTTIDFVCKLDAINKSPVYRSGIGTCHYKFSWLTAAACSEAILIKQSQVDHKPCEITDPLYRKMYDLSMLEGKVYYGNSSNENAEYQFSICSPLRKTNCTKPGTGVCKYIKDKNIGVSEGLGNTNLMWQTDQLYLNYTDGEACGNNRRKYTTIKFDCADEDSLLIDDSDPCATIITWSTTMVCNHRCSTPDQLINLDNLARRTSNYLARGENNTTQYHLNVCEPLVDENYTNCTDGTGVCKIVIDEEGKKISEINLGYPEPGLQRAEDGRMFLRYLNGSACEEDSSRRISTEISFICDVETHAVTPFFLRLGEPFRMSEAFLSFLKMLQGRPTFGSYNDCKYDFNWRTGLACPKTEEGLSEGCHLSKSIEVFNLTQLLQLSLFKVNRKESSGYFNVSVCGDMNKCNGTFVCDNMPYYGQYFKSKQNRPKNLVAFKFMNETQCKNNIFYNSVIKIWCRVWANIAESFLIKQGECNIEPKWTANSTICKQKREGKKPPPVTNVMLMMLAIVGTATAVVCGNYFRRGYRRLQCMNTLRDYRDRFVAWRNGTEPSVDVPMGERF